MSIETNRTYSIYQNLDIKISIDILMLIDITIYSSDLLNRGTWMGIKILNCYDIAVVHLARSLLL